MHEDPFKKKIKPQPPSPNGSCFKKSEKTKFTKNNFFLKMKYKRQYCIFSKAFRFLLRLMQSKTQPLLTLGTLPGDIHQKLGANDKSGFI